MICNDLQVEVEEQRQDLYEHVCLFGECLEEEAKHEEQLGQAESEKQWKKKQHHDWIEDACDDQCGRYRW